MSEMIGYCIYCGKKLKLDKEQKESLKESDELDNYHCPYCGNDWCWNMM